ncbi:RNA dependent RNA polymerase-domain-containing protein [Aspergillus cavernicola]|uniref:RNA-dependent RNA polymerase n=1 Tax=Aspergillus cavernicola TaxID=176166 RepID=A0ABR4IMJ0_9EURO
MASRKPSTFSHVLQSEFLPTDSRWTYEVGDLPKPQSTNPGRWIKSLELVQFRNPKVLDHLLHLAFAGFRLGQFEEERWQSCTARETADYLIRLLKAGITLNGSKVEVAKLVESLGDFSKIETVAKKAKRIGLLFSSCHVLMDVPDGRYEDIDDIERSGYNFTDGCGLIGPKTAQLLSQKMSIISRNTRYHPSVYQIRFKGYKGVITLEPEMPKECWFRFRQSMRRFSGTADRSFAAVAYKPYTYGYLNEDIVLLLSALGVPTKVLLNKQQEHFARLQEALIYPPVAFTFLCSLDQFGLAEKLILSGIEKVSSPLRSLVAGEYKKMLNKRETEKCRILVPKSRLLFGICDPREVLEEGECFLRVTNNMNGGRPTTITGCLKSCIVFSVKGERPAADQMSGGDLDGDTFFVCWDPDLVPSTLSEAARYPPGRQTVSFADITVDDRIEYFARYTSISLGRVKKLFLEWAVRSKDGALSSECQELNRLHSLCVDGNRIKIDERLMKLPTLTQEHNDSFILNILHLEAEKESQQRIAKRGSWEEFDSREVIETILCQPRMCSEFHMLRLAYEWCRRTGSAELSELLPYFNLSALTVEQQHWLLHVLPPSTEFPALVMNGLLRSDILQPNELTPLHLNYPGMRWKRIFSVEDRLANLVEVLEKSFSQFHRKFLVLQVNPRFSIAIYIPQPIAIEDEALVGKRVLVYAFPHTQPQGNTRERIHITSAEYRLYYDHTTFQLYNRQRQNTFIWIGRPGNNDSSFRQVKGKANRAPKQSELTLAKYDRKGFKLP